MKKNCGVLFLFILAGASAGFGQSLGKIPVAFIAGSASTGPMTPAQHLADGTESTVWNLGSGEERGWAEFRFDSPYLVDLVRVTGRIGEGSSIAFSRYADGAWEPFYSGRLSASAGQDPCADLTFDRAVTDRIRMHLSGAPGNDTALEEISFYGRKPESIRHRISAATLITTEKTSAWYPADNLFDGNTRTAWKTEPLYFLCGEDEEIRSFSRADVRKARWNADGEVTAEFEKPARLETVRMYLSDRGNRVPVLQVRGTDGSWRRIPLVRERREPGWMTVDLSGSPVETDAVQVLLHESLFDTPEIAELELWGCDPLPGDRYVEVPHLTTDVPSGLHTFQAYSETDDRCFLEILLPASARTSADSSFCFVDRPGKPRPDEQEPEVPPPAGSPSVELNGFPLTVVRKEILGDFELFTAPLERGTLGKGNNFITVACPSARTPELRIRKHNDDGRLLFQSGSPLVVPNPGASGEAEIGLASSAFVDSVSVVSAAGSPGLSVLKNGVWEPLVPRNVNGAAAEYRIGSRISRFRLDRLLPGIRPVLFGYGTHDTAETPAIRILNPKDNAFPDREDLMKMRLIGFTDTEDCSVSVNGRHAEQRGNFFMLPFNLLPLLGKQPESLTASVMLPGGAKVSDSIRVYTGESGTFTTDQSGLLCTDASSIAVTGTVRHRQYAITANGVKANVSGRNWSVEVPLREGYNQVKVVCEDRSGNAEGTCFLAVVRYGGMPSLRIGEPEDGSYTRERKAIIRGSAAGLMTKVSVNGTPAEMSGIRFKSKPVDLKEGKNEIGIVCTSFGGKTAEKTVTVTLDTEPPVIGAFVPAVGRIIGSSTFDFSCAANDAVPFHVFANGTTCRFEEGSYRTSFQFPDGFPRIRVRAQDAAGNASETEYSVIVDTEPPFPFDVFPDPSAWTNDARPVITFGTGDAVSGIAGYEYRINDGSYFRASSPQRLPPLKDGIHIVGVNAIDRAGWKTASSCKVFIDTIPPAVPSGFSLVPGNGSVRSLWNASDEDVIAYILTRSPAWSDGSERVFPQSTLSYADTEVENGVAYTYGVRARDRAWNESPGAGPSTAVAGLELQPYDPAAVTVAEFQGVRLSIQPGGLPPEASTVMITEVAGSVYFEKALSPVIGPVYRMTVADGSGVPLPEDGKLEKPYVCELSYDPGDLPAGFSERNLGVFYFDRLWSRWIRVDSSTVDTENDIVFFSCDHFTDFSVQATVVQEPTREELRHTGYNPLDTYVLHEDLSILPAGGTVMTRVRELVLPGPAGFDLVLSRIYDFSNAQTDARLAGNGSMLPYLRNQGDCAYSMGQGWRLDLPYIRNGYGEPMIVLPGGAVKSVYDLRSPSTTGLPNGNVRLHFECHDGEDFSFSIELSRELHPVTSCSDDAPLAAYEIACAVLIMRDGTSYRFDDKGRTVAITDPTGLQSITVAYSPDAPRIEYIRDSIGRTIRFTYVEKNGIPLISAMAPEDDQPYLRTVRYVQNDSGALTSAVDAGGRTWTYGYTPMTAEGPRTPFPFDLRAAILALGNARLSAVLETLKVPDSTHTLPSLTELRGSGKGIIRVAWTAQRFEEQKFTRIYATQIRTYASEADANAKTGWPIRLTSYKYEFVPDQAKEQVLIGSVEELEEDRMSSPLRNRYVWELLAAERIRWTVNVLGSGVGRPAGGSVSTAITRLIRIERAKRVETVDPRTGKPTILWPVLETESPLYASGSTSSRPDGRTTVHGSSGPSKREDFVYDGWGNRVIVDLTLETPEDGVRRRTRLTTHRLFSGSDPSAKPNTFDWIPTSDAPKEGPYLLRRDLVLAEVTLDYKPVLDGSNASGGEGACVESRAFHTYNRWGQKATSNEWLPAHNRYAVTSYSYDNETAADNPDNSYGNLFRLEEDVNTEAGKTVPVKRTTIFRYDPNGYATERSTENVETSSGVFEAVKESYSYERCSGLLRSRTDARGYTTTHAYDGLGRIVRTVHPDDGDAKNETRDDNPVTTIAYEDSPNALACTVVFGAQSSPPYRKTRFEFDYTGRLTALKKYPSDGTEPISVTTLTHNRHGITSITGPNGNSPTSGPAWKYTTRFSYDPLGRLELEILPDATESTSDNPVRKYLYGYDTGVLVSIDEGADEIAPDTAGHRTFELKDIDGRTLRQTRYDGIGAGPIVTTYYYDGQGLPVGTVGPRPGEARRTEYDTRGLPVAVIDPVIPVLEPASIDDTGAVPSGRSPVTRYSYDLGGTRIGTCVEAPDHNGKPCTYETTFRVNVLGWVLEETYERVVQDERTKVYSISRSYDRSGNIVSESDKNGNITGYALNSFGKPLAETLPGGAVNTYSYYPDGRLKSVTDARHNSGAYNSVLTEDDFKIEYSYDALGRLVAATLPPKLRGGVRVSVELGYDPHGNLISRKEPDGKITAYRYDERNRLTSETVAAVSVANTISYGYDSVGNIISITDPRGKTELRGYDALNRLVSVTPPGRNAERYGYDAAGNRTSVRNGNGYETKTEYDAVNRVTKILFPDASQEQFFYDRLGRLTVGMDREGRATRYEYTPAGLVGTEKNPMGYSTRFGYDAAGNMIRKLDPQGTEFTYLYNSRNLLESCSASGVSSGQSITYRYDEAGGLVSVAAGSVITAYNGYDPSTGTGYVPDPYGRVLDKTVYDGNRRSSVSYAYDAGDRIASLSYPDGGSVSYSWNPLGELTGMPGWLAEAPGYSYGFLERIAAANSVTLIMSYDDDGRPDLMDWSGADPDLPLRSYEYDDIGSVRKIVRGDGSENLYGYDPMNRLAGAVLTGGFIVDTSVERTMAGRVGDDLFGALPFEFREDYPCTEIIDGTKILELDLGSGSIGLDLMKSYQVIRIALTPENPLNRVDGSSLRVFVSAVNEYPASSEISDFTAAYRTRNDETFLELTLPPGTEGRYVKVKTVWDDRSLPDFSPAHTAEFVNDPEKLVRVYYLSDVRIETYEYDRLGNRTGTEEIIVHRAVSKYRYYANGSRLLTDGTYLYAYDRNGNLTAKGTHATVNGRTESAADLDESTLRAFESGSVSVSFADGIGTLLGFEYDLFGRLVAVKKNGKERVSYRYDADGFRIERSSQEGASRYAYGAGGKLLYEETEDGCTKFVYAGTVPFGLEKSSPDQETTERYYLQTDRLGNVVSVTDAGGTVLWADDYTPFGIPASGDLAVYDWIRYTGKDYDEISGLYYFNARWYDPETGRFISEDPARDGANWYAYCYNNPLAYVDPSGLMGDAAALAAAEKKRDIADSDSQYGHIRPGTEELSESDQRNVYESLHKRIAEWLTQNSPTMDATITGMYGHGQKGLDEILESIPENYRDFLRPYVEDAYRGGQALGAVLGDAAILSLPAIPILGRNKAPKLTTGTSKQKPAVIGENQPGRVDPYAKAHSYDSITTWMKEKGISVWDPNVNKQFIAEMKAQGRQFVDIGPDFARRMNNRVDPEMGRPPSTIYGSERQSLFGYNNYRREYTRNGKYNLPGGQ